MAVGDEKTEHARVASGDLISIARVYDRLAPEYDAQLAQNPVAYYMRERLHDHFAGVFRVGDRVLDLTAGTGADACFLAGRGIEVIAIDVSPAMLAELERRSNRLGLTIKVHPIPAEQLSTLELENMDGVISTFGGLNTISDLPRLARDLARCLNSNGRVIIHALNRRCIWQIIHGAIHGHLQFARAGPVQFGPDPVPHWFYNPRGLWRRYFAPDFQLIQAYGLSVVAAPPLLNRFPRTTNSLLALDRVLGRFFPSSGDFFVMDMEKRDG